MVALSFLAASGWFLATHARADAHWPQWRGPHANGSLTQGHYPAKWSADQVRWKFELPGKGGSSPIVWNQSIFLATPAEGEDAILALDLEGKQRWIKKLGKESPPKHRTLGSSCNSTPATDGRSIFAYFRSGRFVSLGLDGSVKWSQDLSARFGPEQLFWDQGSSPVLTEREVILARMHQGDSWVAGFDKVSGEMKWQVKRNYKVPAENDNGYTTPVFFEHRGRKAFAVWGADHLTAHSADDGKLLWSCGQFNPEGTGYWPAIASPILTGQLAIVPVGRDDRPGQARVHAIRLDGAGDVSGSHRVWKRDDVGVFVATPVEFGGRVLLLRHRGEVVCLDPATGKTRWTGEFPRGTASYYASPVVANGILYAAREDGVVFSARVGDSFEFLGEQPMGERVLATPTPALDRLFIRGDKHLFCIAK